MGVPLTRPECLPMLMARAHEDGRECTLPALTRIPVLKVLGRRSLPHVLEATLAPAILFYVSFITVGSIFAMIAVFAWTGIALGRRIVRGTRIPAILWLATIGLTVRTAVGLVSGSTFFYFAQPIATTVVLAGVFIGSLFWGRPVIAWMAHDFCPISPEIANRPRIVRLFFGLTILWAGVHLATAATTLGMLISLPVATFVLLKTIACLCITLMAIVFTVSWSIQTARAEDLVFAPGQQPS